MSDNPPSAIPEADADDASVTLRAAEVAQARSGFLLITGAKLWFLVSATILNLGLPRLLGDAALFGDYGTINSLISILNMVLVTGTMQAVSKRVSERPELAARIRHHAIKLQTALGGLLFLALMLGANPLCARLLGDETLAPYLRIASVVTLSYAFYASFIGVINGLRDFATQALFDILFATLKVSLIVGFVLAGLGVFGAFLGFASAAVVVTLGAWWVTRKRVSHLQPASVAQPVTLFRFMLKVMGFVLALNLLIQGDVVVLKRAALEALLSVQGQGEPRWMMTFARDAVSDEALRTFTATLTGLYRAAKNVSLLPYQGVIALTFVVFPLLSRATFETDEASTRLYVHNALRVAWLIVSAIAVALLGAGEELAGLLFGEDYKAAGSALLPMILGMAALALMYLVGTVLIAASYPVDAFAVAGSAALGELCVLYGVMSTTPASLLQTEAQAMMVMLTRTAWIAAAAGLVGLSLASWRLVSRLRVPLPLRSMALSSLSALAALALTSLLDTALASALGAAPLAIVWLLFVRALTAGVVFVVLLTLTGQLTREDWAMVRSTLSRRKVS